MGDSKLSGTRRKIKWKLETMMRIIAATILMCAVFTYAADTVEDRVPEMDLVSTFAEDAHVKRGGFQPGYYKILTTGAHAGRPASQPANWGMSAWHAHGARRNHVSAWAAVHSGTHWPMIWKIDRSKRVRGTYTIKTTKYGPKGGKMPAGWGLSAWHAHGAVRNHASSRVAVHSGNYWLMDWKIQRSKRTRGAWTIQTWGGPPRGKQAKGWGLAAWQKHGGRRNHASSWLYVHAGNHWLMDWKLVRVYPRGNCNYRTCSSRHPRRRHSVGHKGSLKGCYNKCYRPYGRRNRHSVCAYVCKGRRHSARRWRHSKIKCRTTAAASNRAGVVYAKQPGGYTMVGGGINNHYRHFNKLSAFEESFPHGSNWRCDTGFGPGRVTCYARSCRMRGLSCTTRSVYKHGSGIAQASLPGGYVMTSGGVFNHYRHWNKHAAFETSIPIGSNTWRCDMGLGSGRFNCYVRGCKPRRGTRLHCITRHSGVGNHHNVQCPGHYSMTGCGQNELRRQWNHLSGFEEIRPHGNGCVCDSGFGPGKNRCYARCCRNIVHRL